MAPRGAGRGTAPRRRGARELGALGATDRRRPAGRCEPSPAPPPTPGAAVILSKGRPRPPPPPLPFPTLLPERVKAAPLRAAPSWPCSPSGCRAEGTPASAPGLGGGGTWSTWRCRAAVALPRCCCCWLRASAARPRRGGASPGGKVGIPAGDAAGARGGRQSVPRAPRASA